MANPTNAAVTVAAFVSAITADEAQAFAQACLNDMTVAGKTIEELKDMGKAELEALVVAIEEEVCNTQGSTSTRIRKSNKASKDLKLQLDAASYILHSIYDEEDKELEKKRKETRKALLLQRQQAAQMEAINKMSIEDVNKELLAIEDED